MAYTSAWQQFANQLNDAYNQKGWDGYGNHLQQKLQQGYRQANNGQDAYSWDWDQDNRLRDMYTQQWNIQRQLSDAQKAYKANPGAPAVATSNVYGPMTSQMMEWSDADYRYGNSIRDLENQRYQAWLKRGQGAQQAEPYGNAIRQMLK